MTRERGPFNDSHEVLMGVAMGAGLAAMAAFWWMWAALHG